MTEKEKAAKGLLYNANYDAELIRERCLCKAMCYEHNKLHPKRIQEREDLVNKILGKTGKVFLIEQPFICDYGYNIEIGENFYANHDCTILDGAKVSFGNNVFIAPNCGFYTAGHPLDVSQRNAGLEYAYPITIGNNVWIGAHVIVLPGVTIGDNAVIGAGSVVTKDIPANVVAVGNPCRVIRNIDTPASEQTK
jgi:galactoside O-acetyltransferase